MVNENTGKTKDFRHGAEVKPPVTSDLAGSTQEEPAPEVDHVRDIGKPFMKDFTGTQPHKNFMPIVRDANTPDPEDEIEVADPKDSSAPESAGSFVSQTIPEPESQALPESIADAVKGSTPPKGSAVSTPPSLR